MVTVKDLDAFFVEGWNRHDVDHLMTFMAEDCVFESTAGPDACGTRHTGRERVREAFARVFANVPDAAFRGGFKAFFTFVIPMLLVANVPAKLLVNKLSSALDLLLLLVISLACLMVSEIGWRLSVRRYTSASS